MYADERHPPRFWGTIVTVALLLLGVILVVVITLSARLRRAETATVAQQLPVPVETAPSAAPHATSASSSPRVTTRAAETPVIAERRHSSAAHTGQQPMKAAPSPVKVVQQPVRVIEKQVRVIEKQVRIIEKPVKVVEKPAKLARNLQRAPTPAAAKTGSEPDQKTFQQTGLPNQLTYDGKTWNASEMVKGLPADLLAPSDQPVDGRTIYHDKETEAPYPHVYVKVAGQTNQYVRYVPTTS
jgi:hypothetical protein